MVQRCGGGVALDGRPACGACRGCRIVARHCKGRPHRGGPLCNQSSGEAPEAMGRGGAERNRVKRSAARRSGDTAVLGLAHGRAAAAMEGTNGQWRGMRAGADSGAQALGGGRAIIFFLKRFPGA